MEMLYCATWGLPRQDLLAGHLRQHLPDGVHQPDALALLQLVRLQGVVARHDDVLGEGPHTLGAVAGHVLRRDEESHQP